MRDAGHTAMGGMPARFPSTRWSLLRQAQDLQSPASREALNHLCRHYWKPVYVYLRSARSMSNEEAKDCTQDFFLEILEGEMLHRYSREAGSFRAYLQGALRYFLLDRHEKGSALKRGGGRRILSLDSEEIPISAGESPDSAFDRQWARSLLDLALEDLRSEFVGTPEETKYRVFERYELAPGSSSSYEQVAQEFGLKSTDISVFLALCRRRLRKLLADRIRDYVSDDRDAAAELSQIYSLLAG